MGCELVQNGVNQQAACSIEAQLSANDRARSPRRHRPLAAIGPNDIRRLRGTTSSWPIAQYGVRPLSTAGRAASCEVGTVYLPGTHDRARGPSVASTPSPTSRPRRAGPPQTRSTARQRACRSGVGTRHPRPDARTRVRRCPRHRRPPAGQRRREVLYGPRSPLPRSAPLERSSPRPGTSPRKSQPVRLPGRATPRSRGTRWAERPRERRGTAAAPRRTRLGRLLRLGRGRRRTPVACAHHHLDPPSSQCSPGASLTGAVDQTWARADPPSIVVASRHPSTRRERAGGLGLSVAASPVASGLIAMPEMPYRGSFPPTQMNTRPRASGARRRYLYPVLVSRHPRPRTFRHRRD